MGGVMAIEFLAGPMDGKTTVISDAAHFLRVPVDGIHYYRRIDRCIQGRVVFEWRGNRA